MGGIYFGSGVIGICLGLIFTLLYISFDDGWKKMLSSAFTVGGTGFSIWKIYDKYNVKEPNIIFISIGIIGIIFIITFVIIMIIACTLMKDEKDKNLIRARDILLGQKSILKLIIRLEAKK